MSTNDTLLISPNHPVFDLPEIVAIEHGLFARHGLRVDFARADESAYDPSERDPIARRKEALFESESADVYNLCEWGGIDRLERGHRSGRIDHLRPAVVAQALVSFDPTLNEPHDLDGVPIAVNEFTGSHYTALHLLGNTLARQEIVVRHVGSPHLRLRALRSGDLRAAMLMEPFLSVALKEGAHLLGSYFYRGSQVVAPHLGQEGRDAYIVAVNEAVDLIHELPWHESARHIVREVEGELDPEELGQPAHPEPVRLPSVWCGVARRCERCTQPRPPRPGRVERGALVNRPDTLYIGGVSDAGGGTHPPDGRLPASPWLQPRVVDQGRTSGIGSAPSTC